ncbi:hypothetical protein BDK92_5041 [Micromonospora pisi]|uniref:Uncharacterized protein n=2 Tax=Micromonospora pisi TaxID=589240 RepID=A0A495JQK0_9ACTN|nr:hypothetical protein BDK92_5041 [Micromonospora pisi]
MHVEDPDHAESSDESTSGNAPREMTTELPPMPLPRKRSTNRGRGYGTPSIAPLELFAVGVSGRRRRNPNRPA